MTAIDFLMMNEGSVIPAKVEIQCHITKIITFKLNLSKPNIQNF